jgi:hypothetical protein
MAKFLRLVSEAEINQPEATPKPPPMPDITGLQIGQTKEVNPGEKITLKADGTVSHEGWWGEQIFKTNGQLVKTISPRTFGYQQQTDATGNVISKTQSITNQNGQEMGSVTQNADGTQSSNVDLGTTVLSQQRDANGNLSNGTATVRGETPAQNQTVTMEDVQRLAGIISEGANPHKVALPVQMAMQHYQQPVEKTRTRSTLIDKYFTEAGEAIQQEKNQRRALINQYASIIAERVRLKESKIIKPKKKTSVCRAGQTQTGMQTKDGKLVPKCSVKPALNEFAIDHGDDKGGEEHMLHKYARMWYNGDLHVQHKVEKILDRMGWEIGEIESEEGGCFVVRSGDEHGRSYIGFALQDLSEARQSAAVKLQRAFEREQAKSAASRKRGEEVMAQAKKDSEKQDQKKENYMQGHSTGFKPGVGPGLQSNEPR